MADVYNRVYLHLVWATYDRMPLLTPEVREVIHHEILAIGRRLNCPVQAIGGVEDHIHVLVRFATTISIGELAQAFKGASSRQVAQALPSTNFKWQGAYSVFPVPPAQLNRIIAYVEHQEEHHADQTLIPALEATSQPRQPGEPPAPHPSAKADARPPEPRLQSTEA